MPHVYVYCLRFYFFITYLSCPSCRINVIQIGAEARATHVANNEIEPKLESCLLTAQTVYALRLYYFMLPRLPKLPDLFK